MESISMNRSLEAQSNNIPRNVNDARKRQRVDSMARSGSVSSGYESDDALLPSQYDHLSLPVISGSEPLPYISWETVTHLLDGQYSNCIDSFHIMDCRFPFEYEGGHVKGAQNCWTREMLTDQFLADMKYKQRVAIIFYCEFSSHRAPAQMKFLRNLDRAIHACAYPKLFCPEVYVMKGGYSNFFKYAQSYCAPETYQPMDDSRFNKELIVATKRLKKSKKDAANWRETDLVRDLSAMVSAAEEALVVERQTSSELAAEIPGNISMDGNNCSFNGIDNDEDEEIQPSRVRARLFL